MIVATVNQQTGKISGAEPGSLTYLHEQGHLAYINKPIYARLSLAEEQFKTLALLFIVIGVLTDLTMIKVGAFVAISFSVLIHAYEEVWAWLYAARHR
jgi:hypothetical protein